jgi:hypothetical protein
MVGGHSIAAWAGAASFFSTLLAIGILDVLNPGQWAEYLSAVVVAFITAGAVYSKHRLEDAKAQRQRAP